MVELKATFTAENLHLLPLRNNIEFIAAYAKQQKSYSSVYVAEGLKYASSWDKSCPEVEVENLPPCGQSNRVGFDTPVLKARTAGVSSPLSRRPTNNGAKAMKDDEPSPKKAPKRSTRQPRNIEISKKRAPPPSKITTSEDESGEQGRRAKERREKKQAKRAITRAVLDNLSTANNGTDEKPKKRQKQEKNGSRKKGAPPGFSLMYGFSATNIGSQRLTAKPSLYAGVFSKGKASLRIRPIASEKHCQIRSSKMKSGFCEPQFLDLRASSRGQAGEPSEGDPIKENDTVSMISVAKEMGEARKEMTPSRFASVTHNDGSVIWDIERGSYVLPSEPCDIRCKELTKHSSKATLSSELHSAVIPCIFDNPCKPPSLLSDQRSSCSLPSVRPSESASQMKLVLPADLCDTSKYFRAVGQPLLHMGHGILDEPNQQSSPCHPEVELALKGGIAYVMDQAGDPWQWDEGCVASHEIYQSDTNRQEIERPNGREAEQETWLEPYCASFDDSSWKAELSCVDHEISESPFLGYNPAFHGDLSTTEYFIQEESLRDIFPSVVKADIYEDFSTLNDPIGSRAVYYYLDDEDITETAAAAQYELDVPLSISASVEEEEEGESSSDEELGTFEGSDLRLTMKAPEWAARVSTSLQLAEMSVACRLKNHWQPQKF